MRFVSGGPCYKLREVSLRWRSIPLSFVWRVKVSWIRTVVGNVSGVGQIWDCDLFQYFKGWPLWFWLLTFIVLLNFCYFFVLTVQVVDVKVEA